jgi:methylenetetrahydrofolate dehydrogenase (NADP+)/methenyltetrahydrofolate cyclohydrolase
MIPCKEIKRAFTQYLTDQVKELKSLGKTPYLVTVLAENSSEQLSFVQIKRKVAEKIGTKFDFIHLTKTPSFEKFVALLKKHALDPVVTGMIIQQPLPMSLQTDSIYNFIPLVKEIEGHKNKTTFLPPLGLAVLTMLKYIYLHSTPNEDSIIDIEKDGPLLKKALKGKSIVVAGRGVTGGKPISQTLSSLRIPYLNVSSKTSNVESYYKEADIIITAVGKKIITPDVIKQGVILLNVGLREENGELKGDFDEDEIKNSAAFYTQTPGGIGPIDVMYLYKNLIDATRMQIK